ncbi:hypothetical protein DR64_7588 [Paraburkholderia xenovorans LB400]|uniref:hypothetical protein n=1 Tax=Paraburkholderia xenovorans TaxID=36873 RepID=UPI000037E225|nr:hypothetical protein [Paraburkholderia xenovorans]AIP34882.1 hypothetical protein DR64_7588 [Paraburkholderia xenovorans LB400]
MNRPILWEHFQPGVLLGATTLTYCKSLSRSWERIFGPDDACSAAEAASIATALMMRGYLHVVTPRPPGNLHARQRLTIDSLPRPGDRINLAVTCLSKELKRERRYVDLQVRGKSGDGRALFVGVMSLIWAA